MNKATKVIVLCALLGSSAFVGCGAAENGDAESSEDLAAAGSSTKTGTGSAGTGLPAYKRLQVVLDEKSPTFAPPTFVRVTPAELLSAAGDE